MGRYKIEDCNTWRVGRGNKVRFWLDEWMTGGYFKRRFPSIYAIAQFKKMLIEDAYSENNGHREWKHESK